MALQLSLFENEKRIILISLMEKYYNSMLLGEKKFEYRTRFLNEPCTAYVYISKTKKSIIAKIEFGNPIIGTPEEISKFSEVNDNCSYKDMYEYFKGKTAYAIPVESIEELSNDISLDKLKKEFPDFVPPQSYYYLDNKVDLLEYIKSYHEED